MSQVQRNDVVVPVTIVDISDNVVAKIVSQNKVLVGWGKKKKATQSETGNYKELGFVPKHVIEVDSKDIDEISISKALTIKEGLSEVTVIGTSKGKGFAGVVKRYRFAGGPKTHGQSDRQRAPGSIGSGTTPGRVLKGTRMAGRMGSDRVNVKNLEVVSVVNDESGKTYLLVKGAIPGANGSLVYVKY